MDAIWTESIKLPHFKTVEGSVKTEVLIIGGGITGILCAYFLQERGIDYILAERGCICSGITGNTTAKITSQHGLIYDQLVKHAGMEKARLYLEANQHSVQKYYELCQMIDCDFEEKTNYVYSLYDREKLEKEAQALHKIGYNCDIMETTRLPFQTVGAISFAHQAQFHPLKFLSHIAKNLNIYEHTFVKKLSPNTAITEKAQITFQKLIFATHFPIDNKYGLYFLKMYQHRSYVLALAQAAQVEGMYIDENAHGLSFRNYGDYLLVGGGSHRTGKKGGSWQELRKVARNYYPSSTEAYHWAAQDCMTLDSVPYIGQYAKRMPNCYVATGFNKWGMTSAMTAATLLTDLVTEKQNPYTEVFSPSRNILKPQLFINAWESVAGLLTISSKRCPHLGCALKWNPEEHTWDCPCHGSRFAEDGHLLNNPANGNLRKH